MYRILKVGRDVAKETELTILNTKGRGRGQKNGKNNSNTTEENYYYNQRRKANELIGLTNINFNNRKSCFVTLTFADVVEYQFAVNEFKRFTKAVRRRYNNFRYIATVELQKRGAIHFHMVCNITKKVELEQFVSGYWAHGTENVKSVYNKNKLGSYITKQFHTQKRDSLLFNKRCYFVSQGLDKPYTIRSWEVGGKVYDCIKSEATCKLIESKSTVNEHAGTVNYNLYSVNSSSLVPMMPPYVFAEKRK